MSHTRVALVKSAGRADAFASALHAVNCEPVLVSPFRVELLPDAEETLLCAVTEWTDWLIVTSANAVPLMDTDEFRECLADCKIAAVGVGTATALHAAGYETTLIGTGGGLELARAFLQQDVDRADHYVHACNEDVRPEFAETCARAGIPIHAVPTYRMVPDDVGARAARGQFDVVVVASPRLAARAAELFRSRPPVVAVGALTAAALAECDWAPAGVSDSPSPVDVARAVRRVADADGAPV